MEAEMNSTTLETFWGKQLSSKNKTYEWNGEEEEEEGLDSTLEIRGACLGVNAKANERNVVTLTAEDESGEEVKHVILSMRLETNEQTSLILAVQPPVKLELVQGSGPVHIVGQMTTVLTDDISSDEDDDDESKESSSAGNVTGKNVQKKRPGEFITQKPAKMAKLQNNNKDKEEEEEDDDDDDEDSEQDVEEDTSMDVSTSPEKVVKNIKKSTKKQVNEVEDDDDEEESDEDEEDSDEEDSDEESGDDDNEKEVKPKAIKFTTPVNIGGKKNNNKFNTPQPGKPLKPSIKTPQSAQMKVTKGDKKNTPKNISKNTPKNSPKGLASIDDIKQKLLKSPNIPKKLEKFNNYMTSTYKITDNSVKKQMWEFVQKNRK